METFRLRPPSDFGISSGRGFLPKTDPLAKLPQKYAHINELAAALPELLASGQIRQELESLPLFDLSDLRGLRQLECAMRAYSYFGPAWRYATAEPATRIPKNIAVPWHYVATRIGRKPALSYKSYCLENWRRIDPAEPIALGNIELLQHFLPPSKPGENPNDEEGFILPHVDIEAHADPIPGGIYRGQKAVIDDRPRELDRNLLIIAAALQEIHRTLIRIPEYCDPFRYFAYVRPYLHAFNDVVFEGIDEYGGVPQFFYGESGSQSSIFTGLDFALGIKHENDLLAEYVMENLAYAPVGHRNFLIAIRSADENGASIRAYVERNKKRYPYLKESFNQCTDGIEQFKEYHHKGLARPYITDQEQVDASNPTDVGTGGTSLEPHLAGHIQNTKKARIR